MSQKIKIIDDKAVDFANKLLSKYLENGFASMPKQELDIYLLHLLIEHGENIKNESGDINYHQLSLALKLSETKVKNLIYQINLKYNTQGNQEGYFVVKLIELIDHSLFEVDKDKKTIKFSVEDLYLKREFEYQISKIGGISDGSFNKNIIKLSKDTFDKLLKHLFDNNDNEEFYSYLKGKFPDKSELLDKIKNATTEHLTEKALDFFVDGITEVVKAKFMPWSIMFKVLS